MDCQGCPFALAHLCSVATRGQTVFGEELKSPFSCCVRFSSHAPCMHVCVLCLYIHTLLYKQELLLNSDSSFSLALLLFFLAVPCSAVFWLVLFVFGLR